VAVQAAAKPGGMPACGALRLARNRAASSGGVGQGRHPATRPSKRQEHQKRLTADLCRGEGIIRQRRRIFSVNQGAEAQSNGAVVVAGIVGRAVRREHAEEVISAG